MTLLPYPDAQGGYVYPDGCAIWPSCSRRGKWVAHWANRALLRGDNDEKSFFDSPEEAAKALLKGGEGPAEWMPKPETPKPVTADDL